MLLRVSGTGSPRGAGSIDPEVAERVGGRGAARAELPLLEGAGEVWRGAWEARERTC